MADPCDLLLQVVVLCPVLRSHLAKRIPGETTMPATLPGLKLFEGEMRPSLVQEIPEAQGPAEILSNGTFSRNEPAVTGEDLTGHEVVICRGWSVGQCTSNCFERFMP